MITDRVFDKTIVVISDYDSSRHTGFRLSLREDGFCSEESPDKFLTESQIKTIEAMILFLAKQYISEETK